MAFFLRQPELICDPLHQVDDALLALSSQSKDGQHQRLIIGDRHVMASIVFS